MTFCQNKKISKLFSIGKLLLSQESTIGFNDPILFCLYLEKLRSDFKNFETAAFARARSKIMVSIQYWENK